MGIPEIEFTISISVVHVHHCIQNSPLNFHVRLIKQPKQCCLVYYT
jgi:hypothetical protein